MSDTDSTTSGMRIFGHGLLVGLALLAFYLAIFFLYFKAFWINFDFLGKPLSLRIDHGLQWLYTPCDEAERAWDARQERKQKEAEYYRSWAAADICVLILPDGSLTIRYYDQTLRGVGRFELDEDLRLHFAGECDGQIGVSEGFDEKNPQLLKSYEYEKPMARRCKISIRTHEDDDYKLSGVELWIHAADDPEMLLGCGFLSM